MKKSITPLLLFWLLFTSATIAQRSSLSITPGKEEQSEVFYDKLVAQRVLKSVQKQVSASNADIKTFHAYYLDTITADLNKYTVAVANNLITSDADVTAYANKMVAKYVGLYNAFVQIKTEYPSSIAEYINRSHAPSLPTCNTTPCDNLGFENGTLSGWTGCYCQNTGTSSFSSTAPVCTGPYGAIITADNDPNTTGNHPTATNQLYITSGARTDPISGQPVVCPSGGNYSCMIGDSTIAGSQQAVLENTFMVTAATCNFTYYYSVILQNPGHTVYQQPYFNVTMFDQNGDTIPFCGSYAVISGPGIKGYDSTTYNGSKTYYRPWTTVFVPLQNYIGQCVSIVVKVSDCEPGGHFGYAYFDCTCAPLQIITSAPAICGNPITLTAPAGGASYQWTGPCIVGASNTQTISVGCAGKYTVIIQSVIGATCADTLDTIIASSTAAPPVPYFKADTVCLGNPTQFTNLTTPAGGATYTWNFGDGSATSSDTNPVHTYTVAGTYTVNLSALESAGCGGDTNLTVVVNGTTVAGFKAPPVCLNNPTVFTDTSTGATSWSWNFGETSSGSNNVSNLQNPTHTYASAGTFTVTLITGKLPCTDTSIQTVVVNPLPTAAFNYTQVCVGQATVFTDSSFCAGGSIVNWNWNFGDPASGPNNISTSQNPTHTYSACGTYPVILTVTSNNGCQSTVTLNVTVSCVPVAAFNATTVCQGHATQFTDLSTVTSGTITAWSWKFGDGGTSAKQNPAYIYKLPGTYTATLTITTSGGCTDSVTNTVTVNPTPVPLFTATTVCQGVATTFTDGSTIAAGGTITSWAWNFGDASGTSALANPTYTYAKAGTYTVTLTVTSNNGCDSTYQLPVTVNPLPTPSFTANTPCQGNATVFNNTSTISSGSISTYGWSFGDGSTSTAASPSYTYSVAGTYTIELVAVSNNGCVDSTKGTVTVNPNPVVDFKANDTVGCVPLCVSFTDLSTISNGNIISWNWDFGDSSANSTQQNPSHCYTKVGTFSVTLTVTSSEGCSTTFTRVNYITTYPVPVAKFLATPNPVTIIEPTINFIDQSAGNPVSWYWTFGDNLDSVKTTQNTIHTYPDTGTFWVTLIIKNKYGCVDSVKEPVTIQPDWTFYVPNAFSPNGDGINDYFSGVGTSLLSYEMWIFDRWGMQLYHCTDINKPWDGKVQNSTVECQEDTYVYLIIITDVFHNQHRYVGKVTIIR